MKSEEGNFGNFAEAKSEEDDHAGDFGSFGEPAEKVE